MLHAAHQIISTEHRALAAVLSTLSMLVARHQRAGTPPDFTALRAMLFYVDEFPERLHHHKETELLFPMLRSRTREADAVLDALERDHAHGESAIRELEHALLAYEMMGESRRATFEHTLEQYTKFYLAHMAREEQEVLPLAERVLSDADWQVLDDAFGRNADPLAGHAPAKEYEALFSRIARIVPAPYGLGEPAAS
jgi:hemerythrin-like domain-containing protein